MSSSEKIADLHCHTTFSDGRHTPQEMYEQAVQLGLDYLAIADHNTVGGTIELLRTVNQEATQLISGVELSLWSGHFLLLDIPPEKLSRQLQQWDLRAKTWLVRRPWSTVKDMLWWAKDMGGLVLAAHPLMPFGAVNQRNLEELTHKQLIHGAEIHNADIEGGLGFLYPLWQQRVQKVVNQLQLPAYANSDAHQKERLGLRFSVFSGKPSVSQSPVRLGGLVR